MWLTGLWGWGEADAGEWQTLYRIEGARRALAQSRERPEVSASVGEASPGQAAIPVEAAPDAYFRWLMRYSENLAALQWVWDHTPMGKAAMRRQRRAYDLRLVTRWARARVDATRLTNEIAAAGSRNGWMYEQRLLGRSFQSIAHDVGVSSDWARQIYRNEERRRGAAA